MRHLALLCVVSRCPPLLFSAALSGLAISVEPLFGSTYCASSLSLSVDLRALYRI